ncbi:MAG TPA: alpha/beta hydrolase [Blastocatellia bacterium]|nr:alpha/beta hydrolase [Blastocatellia bacterium]
MTSGPWLLIKSFWSSDRFMVRVGRIFLLSTAGAFLSLLVIVMAFEDRFIYFPAKYPEGFWNAANLPARKGEVVPRIEDCWFMTRDGLKLHGWYCAPQRKIGGEMQPVPAPMLLLWFHGNAGNLSHRYEMIRMLIRLPVQILIIDYRGYGRSEGRPSEEGLYLDGEAAWKYLTSDRGLSPDRIIIFGKSLGGVVAIDLASKVRPAGLIIQSSFTCAADMAARLMPFLPRSLIRTKMSSIEKIGLVRCRKLFIHSRTDDVVPFDLGYRLFEAAPEPKQFYEVKGALHNDTHIAGGKAYMDALSDFIESCSASGR